MVEAGSCVVTQLKTIKNDGYSAMQIGYDDLADKKISRPVKGHFAKTKTNAKRHVKEFPLLNDKSGFFTDPLFSCLTVFQRD